MQYTTVEEKTGKYEWTYTFVGGVRVVLEYDKDGYACTLHSGDGSDSIVLHKSYLDRLRKLLLTLSSHDQFLTTFATLRLVDVGGVDYCLNENAKERKLFRCELDTLATEMKELKSGLSAASCSTMDKEKP